MPANAVYFDILIEFTPQDEAYSDFNAQRNAIPADSQIALYNEAGYMSLSFHYKNLDNANMEIESPGFHMRDANQSINRVSPAVKAVILDRDGNILQISDAIRTAPESVDEFAYRLIYDAAQAAPTLEFRQFYKGMPYFAYFLMLLPMILLRFALSVGAETLMAIPFKLRPAWKVLVVNVVTQVLLIALMQFSGLPYMTALLIGEAFVYIAEFVAYLLLYKSTPRWKIALYTLTANTLTLVIGLVMNAYFY